MASCMNARVLLASPKQSCNVCLYTLPLRSRFKPVIRENLYHEREQIMGRGKGCRYSTRNLIPNAWAQCLLHYSNMCYTAITVPVHTKSTPSLLFKPNPLHHDMAGIHPLGAATRMLNQAALQDRRSRGEDTSTSALP
jgi:hypothetical protein